MALSIFVVLVCLLRLQQVSGIKCGPQGNNNLISSRIGGGEEADREQWPFIVALYRANTSRYFCGGTLLTNRHILTAAHCIQDKGKSRPLLPDDIELHLGVYNLTAKEDGAVLRNVFTIFVHPDWNVNGDRYDADIAVLVLSENVTFSTHIGPVPLPPDNIIFEASNINVRGTIVGWGFTENSTIHEDIPRQADIETYDHSHCFMTYAGIASLSSTRTFCAGSEEGNPGKGDSGGGFFVCYYDAWAQYGIISSTITDTFGHVTRTTVGVYTNVRSFQDWIRGKVVETGGALRHAIKRINMVCGFYFFRTLAGEKYACVPQNWDFQTEDIYVKSFNGSHFVEGRNDEDVDMIFFMHGTMFSIPNGIGAAFTNLKSFRMQYFLKTKSIKRSNFEDMENLIEIAFANIEIDELNFDAMWDLPALEIFVVVKSRLNVLHEKTFENNERLKYVDLNSNLLEFLPRNIFKNNFLLEEVNLSKNSLKIIETDFSALKNIKVFDLRSNTCTGAYYNYSVVNDGEHFKEIAEFERPASASPEDVKLMKTFGVRGEFKINFNEPEVERVRRAHLNDLENILPYLFVGMFYVLTSPSAATATLLFKVAAIARIVHTIVYTIVIIPQPARGTAWAIHYLITFYMAISVLLYTSSN